MILKNNSCHSFSFLQGLCLSLSISRTIPSHLPFFQGWGKTMLRQKSKLGQKRQVEKSDLLGFTPKSLPILDLGVQHWNNAKIQPIPKSRNFSKCFIALFVTFLEFSDTCQNFFGHWHNFFYSHYFCFKFGRMLQDADVKMYCNFQIFCVWYRRYDILHVKNDQNSPNISTNLFLFFPKYLHNSCINMFTSFGSWPTFSVPNEFF